MSQSKTTFNEWLEDETTVYFRKYLEDSIKQEIEVLADTIANGGILTEGEQIQTAAVVSTLREILSLDLETIENFYTKE